MEGVLIRAKRAGSVITITVVSLDHGRYRTSGCDLAGPQAIDVSAGRAATADLRLREAGDGRRRPRI